MLLPQKEQLVSVLTASLDGDDINWKSAALSLATTLSFVNIVFVDLLTEILVKRFDVNYLQSINDDMIKVWRGEKSLTQQFSSNALSQKPKKTGRKMEDWENDVKLSIAKKSSTMSAERKAAVERESEIKTSLNQLQSRLHASLDLLQSLYHPIVDLPLPVVRKHMLVLFNAMPYMFPFVGFHAEQTSRCFFHYIPQRLVQLRHSLRIALLRIRDIDVPPNWHDEDLSSKYI